MSMDIKAKIQEVVNKVKSDKTLADDFKKDPVKTVEKLAGIDLPDGAADKIVDGVKAALAGDKLSDAASGIKDKLKNLF